MLGVVAPADLLNVVACTSRCSLARRYSSDALPTYTAGPRGALLLLSAGFTISDDGSIDSGGGDSAGGSSSAAAAQQQQQQRPQAMQLNRLSSLMPLRRTVACDAGPLSDAL